MVMPARYELDHVFICVSANAPEAGRLVDFGLTEGTRNIHPGQGTANRRFFFHNAMLELLWVHDAAEADGESAGPLRLAQRWQQRGATASPFGIGLRPANDPGLPPPFAAWEYRPAYLPPSWCFHIATNSDRIAEPFLFYMTFGEKPDPNAQPVDHAAGLREVTALRIDSPAATHPSAPMQAAAQTGAAAFRPAAAPLMELGFDGEREGKAVDFRPHVPLRLCW